jgi:3-dehydroquinate synthase
VIHVSSSGGGYDIQCRWGALDDLGSLMRDAGLSGTAAFVVSDDGASSHHGKRGFDSLERAGFAAQLYAFAAGEASKNLDTVRAIYDWLIQQRAERSSPIVALGGGVVGDVAGFAAATYLRGVPFVQVPTTLLAMADAAIGGKVGVDHPAGKNLIGAFYPPRLVLEDPGVLVSLPERELRSGFAEVIKHALIMDPPMLDFLEEHQAQLLALDPQLITELVARNAALKASIVSRDEREGGLRMILNYGHTAAHAIEAVTGYTRVNHGEADSVGMMIEAEIGSRMGITPAAVGERQRSVFSRYGLPLRFDGIEPDRVLAATSVDKKVAAGRVRWVLLEDFGMPVIRDDVPPAVARDVIAEHVA